MSMDNNFHIEIIKRNEKMLEEGNDTDVTFMVGPEQMLIHAHKYMLISHSPVFRKMLLGPFPVENVSPEVFRQILRFIYCGDVQVPEDKLHLVAAAADSFDLTKLLQNCQEKMRSNLNDDNVLDIFEISLKTSDERTITACCFFIYLNTEAVISSEKFLCISLRCLVELIKHHPFNMTPEHVFLRLKEWGMRECSKKRLSFNGVHLRKVLTDTVLIHVRFRNMTKDFFEIEIKENLPGLLSPAKQNDIWEFLTSRQAVPANLNFPESLIFLRFANSKCSKGYIMGKPDSLSFMLDVDVILTHFLIYGTCNPGQYEIDFRLVSWDDTCPENGTKCIIRDNYRKETDGHTKIYDINLGVNIEIVEMREKVKLQANNWFSIHAIFRGPPGYYGTDGYTHIFQNGVHITFKNNSQGRNGTTVNYGQFPGFFFQKF